MWPVELGTVHSEGKNIAGIYYRRYKDEEKEFGYYVRYQQVVKMALSEMSQVRVADITA
jgi:hypothetical protein